MEDRCFIEVIIFVLFILRWVCGVLRGRFIIRLCELGMRGCCVSFSWFYGSLLVFFYLVDTNFSFSFIGDNIGEYGDIL